MTLDQLKPGQRACIEAVQCTDPDRLLQFLSIGLLEGSEVEILHEAPISRDPIAVRVRGATVAIRKAEASQIQVRL